MAIYIESYQFAKSERQLLHTFSSHQPFKESINSRRFGSCIMYKCLCRGKNYDFFYNLIQFEPTDFSKHTKERTHKKYHWMGKSGCDSCTFFWFCFSCECVVHRTGRSQSKKKERSKCKWIEVTNSAQANFIIISFHSRLQQAIRSAPAVYNCIPTSKSSKNHMPMPWNVSALFDSTLYMLRLYFVRLCAQTHVMQ